MTAVQGEDQEDPRAPASRVRLGERPQLAEQVLVVAQPEQAAEPSSTAESRASSNRPAQPSTDVVVGRVGQRRPGPQGEGPVPTAAPGARFVSGGPSLVDQVLEAVHVDPHRIDPEATYPGP